MRCSSTDPACTIGGTRLLVIGRSFITYLCIAFLEPRNCSGVASAGHLAYSKLKGFKRVHALVIPSRIGTKAECIMFRRGIAPDVDTYEWDPFGIPQGSKYPIVIYSPEY